MPSIIAGSRARLGTLFKRDFALFDPAAITFTYEFTPSTIGLPIERVTYNYLIDAQVVRRSLGSFYVDVFIERPGTIIYTWRSTAWGEEVNVEEVVQVNARRVLER